MQSKIPKVFHSHCRPKGHQSAPYLRIASNSLSEVSSSGRDCSIKKGLEAVMPMLSMNQRLTGKKCTVSAGPIRTEFAFLAMAYLVVL